MTMVTLTPAAAFAVDAVVKGTMLMTLVALIARALRKQPAALRHLVWSLGVVGLVTIPVLTGVLPFRIRMLPAASTSVLGSQRSARGLASSVSAERPLSKSDSQVPNAESREPTSESLNVWVLLLWIWIGGSLALLLRFGTSLLVVHRITRRARDVTDENWLRAADRAARALGVGAELDIRVSDEVAMPFASGLLHPTIVLPASAADWTEERREAVLKHEIAHLSRGDLAMNTLSHFTRALYWFHPLAWLAAHKIRVEGERACDDAVLRDGSLASEYADHLLSIVRTVGASNSVPAVALAMARASDFEGRLLAILEPDVPRSRLSRVSLAAVAAGFLVVIMPLAAMSAERRVGPSTLEAQEPASAPAQPPVAKPGPPTKQLGTMQVAAVKETSNPTINALVETLSDSSANVRQAAVHSLGQLGDPRAIAALSKALKTDPDARVREAAANALGEIDDNRAVPALVDALRTEKVAAVRGKIVGALGELKDPSSVSAIAAAARDANTQVRREVANALSDMESQEAAPTLVLLLKDEDADVRRHAADGLGNLKAEGSIDALMAAAKDPDNDVRRNVINALGNFEDMKALPTFIAALKDEDSDVRSHAADAIHQIDGIKKAPQALIDALTDPNRDVRKNAANSLGEIGDLAAVPGLTAATKDGDSDVRRHAAEALSEIGGPEAMQVLMGLLKDPDPEVRKTAAEALGSKRR